NFNCYIMYKMNCTHFNKVLNIFLNSFLAGCEIQSSETSYTSFMPCETLPVVLVAGFLGAGKTTLIRGLIQDGHARGLKLCVVVNEFGAAAVAGDILEEAGAELLASLTGGCACCSGQDDLHDTILEIALRPQGQQPDVV